MEIGVLSRVRHVRQMDVSNMKQLVTVSVLQSTSFENCSNYS